MNFNILGPFDIRDREGRVIGLPGGRVRSLLVFLLIQRGELVSVDRIVDALWGEHAPGTAAKAVQGYVSQLRRVLEPDREPGDADGLIVTRPPGYALRQDEVTVDATRFVKLAGEGRRALEDGSAAEASLLLDEALGLWRGPALAEFAFDDFAQPEIRRLEELRLSATEDRIESLLRLGRHGELEGELESLVATYPLRERLRGQSMLALYRSGRQTDALQVYRDGRRLLAGELGLEPGPEIQQLERAILAHDPALKETAPAPPPAREPEREAHEPALSGPSDRRRRLAVGAALIAALIAAALLAVLLMRNEAPAAIAIVTPAVVAVDPDTNRVVASIRVGSKPVSVAGDDGVVWVGDARDGTVTRVDPVSRRVVNTIGIGLPAIDLAPDLGGVWVATGGFGTILRIDSELGAVAERFDLGDPGDPVVPAARSIGVGEGRIWVGAFDGLVSIDPDSGEQMDRVDLGQSAALQIAVGSGAVWATTITRRAKRVEARAAQVTAEFYAGTLAVAIALDRSAVWVGGTNDGQLWKLDPVTGSTLLTSRAGTGASAIAIGLGGVWIASSGDRTLVRVDPQTGDVVETIAVGGSPEDVAVGGGLVWVTVQDAKPGS